MEKNDYYPFGMVMPGRQYGTMGRYGFNGKEQDPEVKGSGTQYDYGFRIYDPRVGKFLSVDPLSSKYSMLTPYQFASNRPIDGIDLDGLEYLNATLSKINIAVSYIEFNGQIVISGTVRFDRSKIDRATRGYLDYAPPSPGSIGSPRAVIAVFQHRDYTEILEKKANASKPKQPEAEDIDPESLRQPTLKDQPVQPSTKNRNPFNKDLSKAGRARNRRVREDVKVPSPNVPGGGASPKGDLLIEAVQLVGDIGEGILTRRVDNDFSDARSQLSAVGKVANDIQYGLNTKIITQSDLPNLSAFANYLLDGDQPTKWGNVTDKDGKSVFHEYLDTKMLARFEEIKTKISQKRNEANKPDQCAPCVKN